MTMEWWHWAGFGLILMIAELIVPAFVLVWFGLGALLVAVSVALWPALALIPQLLVWILASLALVFVWFKLFKPHQHKVLIGRSSAAAIGEVGLLVSDIDTFQKAQVRFQKPLMGSDVWECVADQAIAAGARVKVVAVEGSLLKITTA
jgi:membrane protein implicated in regulation of membrane protease activity